MPGPNRSLRGPHRCKKGDGQEGRGTDALDRPHHIYHGEPIQGLW